jgi:hypothetical protein
VYGWNGGVKTLSVSPSSTIWPPTSRRLGGRDAARRSGRAK